ncbi:MAG: MFS transporter [Liquorilactobacillus nagelii]|uniref:MFS transporter n=1 Tax=Liquorilactobacillus nagelii TaxID=82688 RepID=UPI0024312082|nr:MFS transporter [Liquorilactobacillus nagelii]MCI1920889.1 MFS transporter [Liquorilactobacillus nagelii]MCI1976542.1 MFS transporter [Liquorilactobacillus nagelii]
MLKDFRKMTTFARRLLAIAFLMSISQSTMTTTYPILMKQFGVQTNTVQWLTTGFMVAMTLVMPLSPWLLDNVPLKKLLNGIVGVFIAGTVVAMLAPSFSWIICGRLIEGLAVGALFPVFQSLILESSSEKNRGLAMGVVGLVMGSALAVGPIISGVILQFVSWRALFGLFIVLLVFLIVRIQTVIKVIHPLAPHKFDWLSAVLLIGFGGLLYAINLFPTVGLQLGWWLLLLTSLGLLIIFAWRQKRLSQPFLNLQVLHFPGYTAALLLTGISYSGLIIATVILPLYYQQVFQVSPFWSGLLLVPAAYILSRLNPLAGKLLNRLGLKRLVWIGMALIAGGFLLLGTLGAHWLWWSVIGGILLESGNAFTMMPALAAANNALPKDLMSHGTALITTMRQVIGAASVVIASGLIAYFADRLPYAQALLLTSRWLLLFPLLGLLLSFVLKTKKADK